MNKYKLLVLNTAIFAVGSFGAKIFSLLLNNLYTKYINPADLYAKSILETLVLFLLPVFTFSLTEAIVRYGLDKNYDKKQVFTTIAVFMLAGMLLMIPAVPMLQLIPVFSPINGYSLLLYLLVFTSSARTLCSQFVRAREQVKLFAIEGILFTMALFVFNLIFIAFLGLGVNGFLIAVIISDIISVIFLFIAGKQWQFVGINGFSISLGKEMLKFSLPLIPTTVMWAFTGFSDQLFIGNMHSDRVFLGEDAAGVYAAATKIPNLLAVVSSIFFQAWNMSAITENDSADRNIFYEKVYSAYEAMLFLGSAVLILFIKPVSAVLINTGTFEEYRTAFKYAPLLIAASVFTCLNLFLAGIYTATKHTKNAFYTMLAVVISNIVLNLTMIPKFGIQGAALATFLSYLFSYLIRMVDTRRFVPFNFSVIRTAANTIIILLMCLPVIFGFQSWLIWEVAFTAAILVLNYKALLNTAIKLVKKEA
ncbi:polysaccharide biosynthesis C-terminal domain-containing protein [Ruminococcus flavefaciens]|uniref:lipid II flippase MurJ n=1 Tax=Ruminococcus flavefaciens TaxID=1265 RepID=UPI0004663CFB|nr:polysaccharide biosynthesis C-terminal domain-containing protein [Ruminococcus flavefaciens]